MEYFILCFDSSVVNSGINQIRCLTDTRQEIYVTPNEKELFMELMKAVHEILCRTGHGRIEIFIEQGKVKNIRQYLTKELDIDLKEKT